MPTPRATLFNPADPNPTTGRRAIDIGSDQERQLFAAGWKLETPTQSYQSFQNPTREITKGAGVDLYASEGGVNTLIPGPSKIQGYANQGYADTRRQLDISQLPATQAGPGGQMVVGGGAGSGSGAAWPSTGTGGTGSGGNIYQRFNDSVNMILMGMKGGDNFDLIKRRNDIIQAKFKNDAALTPERLRHLSPEQQQSLRSMDKNTAQAQVTDLNSAIEARNSANKQNYDMAIDMIDRAERAAKLGYEMSQDEQKQAREGHAFMLETLGSRYIEAMSPENRRNVEKSLKIQPGSLDGLEKALKEQESEKKYQGGIVGEYQFYVDLEQAAGRTPVGFNEYQTLDANRKAKAAGGGGNGPTKAADDITEEDRTNAVEAYQLANDGDLPAQGMIDTITRIWLKNQAIKALAPKSNIPTNPLLATGGFDLAGAKRRVPDPLSPINSGGVGDFENY